MKLMLTAAVVATALAAVSGQALAQFVPTDKGVSQADIDKAIDARLKKSGAPGATPAPGPFTAGNGVAPGGPGTPGTPGTPGAPGAPAGPTDPVSYALSQGARFVGCINHRAYFAKKGGGKLTFEPAVQRAAVRERIIPACR